MEDIHNFLGGMHSNFDEQNQPKNTYREAYNWIRTEDGSLVSENGTLTIEDYPSYLKVIGSVALGEEIILISAVEDGELLILVEIGVVNVSNEYAALLSTNDLDIPLNAQLQVIAKKDYRGHRIIYFVDINGAIPARRIDIDDTYIDIASETLNFLESKLPIVTLREPNGVTETGSLPTGVYQFSARLVTATGNRTTVGLLTNVIPITNESTSSGVNQFDGDLPQADSFKAINLSISNIDVKFKFIEIIATTYEGLTNTPKSNVVGLKTIQGDSMSFTYSSLEQNQEELTLDEITVEPIEYTNPKTVTQKDSRLIYGNVGVHNYDKDLQAIANAIVVKYKIENLSFFETVDINTTTGKDEGGETYSFDNYDGEEYTTKYKGYQRDEVYSFAIAPIYKNGSIGYAYHIPAKTAESTTAANTTTKELGTYVCATEEYPTGYGYPTGLVRYHKMPSMYQESIFDGTNIRVLGLEFSNINFDNPDIIGYAIVRELRTEDNKSILAQGIVNPLTRTLAADTVRTVSPFAGKSHYDNAIAGIYRDYAYDSIAFYSPETTIWNNSMKSANKIVPLAYMEGGAYIVNSERSSSTAAKDQYAHAFLNYTELNTFDPTDVNHQPSAIDQSTVGYVYNGQTSLNGISSYTVDTEQSNGFLFFKTNTDVAVFKDSSSKDRDGNNRSEINYKYGAGGTSEIYMMSGGTVALTHATVGDTCRNLFNLVATRTNQYGSPLDKEYILVDYKLLSGTDDDTIEVFGGDIFINKTALVSTTRASINNLAGDSLASFRTMSYFFCESTINTAYRHYIPDKTIAYYPKVKNLSTFDGKGILQVEPQFGHANGYNKQYSFENTIKKFFSKQLLQLDEVERFSNRAIYTEQSIEGEQYDAYRVVLANNYHDIPKNKGEITNLFVHKNDLYIHTTQSLWKSSFNERVTQASSAGEVVLGNGGLFPRPSLEVFPTAGGYAGSKHPLATCVTPFGTLFVDSIQKKIFLLGEGFDEVDAGMYKELGNYLVGDLTSAYDYENNRWILVGSSFVISFQPKLKSWTAWHSYRPNHITSVGTKTLISKQGNLGLLGEGDKGVYFDEEVEASSIVIISNDNPLVEKSFDNLLVNCTSEDLLDSFNELTVSNPRQIVTKTIVVDDDYDFIPLDSETQAVRKGDDFKLSIPVTEEDEARIKGKWMSLELTYNNSDNNNFVVKYLTVKYRPVAR